MAGKDRKKELARQRYERQMQRRAARRARARRMKIIGTVVAVAVVAGGSGAIAFAMDGSGKKPKAAASPKLKPGECGYNPLPAEASQGAKEVGKPPIKPVKGTYTMAVNTNLGKITVEMDGNKAPCTVNSFNYLAGKKFFNNTKCHRLTTKGIKVLQCGDPSGTGAGGPTYGYANENVPAPAKDKLPDGSPAAEYQRGVVAMAHSSLPNSNGSQFFIVWGKSKLPADYTIFGKVTQGLDVVDSVADAGAEATPGMPKNAGDGAPKKKVEIKDLVVTKM